MTEANRCVGGILHRPGPVPGARWAGGDTEQELFVSCDGPHFRLFPFGPVAVLLRGLVVSRGGRALGTADVAEQVRCHYLEYGDLPVDQLEGSFTLTLLDADAGQVLLYRNLVGNGFTYYTAGRDGFLFSGNLADLLDARDEAPRTNRRALPSFFLYRFVQGRETLVEDVFRLLPGELVTFDDRGLRQTQRQRLGDLQTAGVGRDGLEELEATTAEVLGDCARRWPDAANLLSGGVDSSYLQAHWNAASGSPGRSFAVRVAHARGEAEAEYARTAARAFGTEHTFVPVPGPFAGYLVNTIANLGEPPHHVQTCYFGTLAAALRDHGADAGLCGQGADALFGLGSSADLDTARTLRRLLPFSPLRRLGTALGRLPRTGRLHDHCTLADVLADPAAAAHPLNQAGAWTDWDAVTACFGPDEVARATAERRTLLDLHGVRGNVLEQVHACDFLTDSTDTASLWGTLFHRAGAELVCPWLDSRLVRLAWGMAPEVRFPFRQPKGLLKRALARRAPPELAYRQKLGFGQPVFEWLAPGGQLRSLAERCGAHDFLDRAVFRSALARPGWFLYSLLCYDLWHQLFIERTLPRTGTATECRPSEFLAATSCR